MFRLKLSLRKYSLQRKRFADTAFLWQIYGLLTKHTLALGGSYGYFNRANILGVY